MNKKSKKPTVEDLEELKKLAEELEKKIKEQKELYDLNLQAYGNIVHYRKEIFGEDGKQGLKNEIATVLQDAKTTKKHIDEFDSFWIGDDENLPFNDCKTTIVEIHAKAEGLEELLNGQKTTINDFTVGYQEKLDTKLEEIDIIKKNLQNYRDQVVGGSLFKAYEKRTEKNDILSESYGKYSIWCLLGSAFLMGVLLVSSFFCEPNKINYILP